ncbi:MAG: efflux RND transporter periplasmic adaptor subunit [Verrucomicrobiae bacterium]|nr:efflux RND transporter periplasmic adaptor subunit [Verrucomicrobiae bacterium]
MKVELPESPPAERVARTQHTGRLAWWLAGMGVLILAGVVTWWLMATSPRARRKPPPPPPARLVEVQPVRTSVATVRVEALGTVQPAREVTVYPRVSGVVQWLDERFEPGGRFREGEPMVRLDARDFELAIRQREADRAQIASELELERGQQAIARREYELLTAPVSDEQRDLMLRQPQLRRLEARLAAAEAALDQARLDWERATIRAPFTAVVVARQVNVGTAVTPATPIATLYGTEKAWVMATVPVEDLVWLETGRTVARLRRDRGWPVGSERSGRVTRVRAELERQGRLAQVVVEVEDPLAVGLAAGQPPLWFGDYVRVTLEGRELSNVVVLAREWLREDDTVWLLDEQSRLEIRPVSVAHRGRRQVVVREGLRDGERVVTSLLTAPVAGMPLRAREDAR